MAELGSIHEIEPGQRFTPALRFQLALQQMEGLNRDEASAIYLAWDQGQLDEQIQKCVSLGVARAVVEELVHEQRNKQQQEQPSEEPQP